MSIRIAIADDHTLIAECLSKILALHPNIQVGPHYNTGAALLAGLEQEQPDVLLLDIQFPDISGYELAQKIVPLYPDMGILAISSLDDPFEIQHIIQQGCLSYVHKTVSSKVLVQAIETTHRGERFLEQSVKDRLLQAMMDPKETPLNLIEKELEILELICEGLSNMEIGDRLFMSHRTIEKYKLSFYRRFGVQNAVNLARLAAKYRLIK